jgi:hypothetical protein
MKNYFFIIVTIVLTLFSFVNENRYIKFSDKKDKLIEINLYLSEEDNNCSPGTDEIIFTVISYPCIHIVPADINNDCNIVFNSLDYIPKNITSSDILHIDKPPPFFL